VCELLFRLAKDNAAVWVMSNDRHASTGYVKLGIAMQPTEQPTYAFSSNLTRKGQVTLPAPIRRLLGVGAQDQVTFVVAGGQVRVTAASSVTARTAGLLASDHPMLSPREEQAIAETAMAEEAAPQ